MATDIAALYLHKHEKESPEGLCQKEQLILPQASGFVARQIL